MKAIGSLVIAVALLVAFPICARADTIEKDTTFSGVRIIRGTLYVNKGVTLTIEPGSAVIFTEAQPDAEGLAQCGMVVKGNIVAKGLPAKRILFSTAKAKPGPGNWGEIKVFESAGSAFVNCDFRYGGWGLHVHDSDLKIDGCTFVHNSFGGVRMKGGNVEITRSLFLGMEIGVRYWKSTPKIHHNVIADNQVGVFCREGGAGSAVNYNDIWNNSEYDVKLGDAQKEDVDFTNNWWGQTDLAAIKDKIFDHAREDYIGRALIEPTLKEKVVIN